MAQAACNSLKFFDPRPRVASWTAAWSALPDVAFPGASERGHPRGRSEELRAILPSSVICSLLRRLLLHIRDGDRNNGNSSCTEDCGIKIATDQLHLWRTLKTASSLNGFDSG